MGSVWNEEEHGNRAIAVARAGEASITEAAEQARLPSRQLSDSAPIRVMGLAVLSQLLDSNSDEATLDALIAEANALLRKARQPGLVPTNLS